MEKIIELNELQKDHQPTLDKWILHKLVWKWALKDAAILYVQMYYSVAYI